MAGCKLTEKNGWKEEVTVLEKEKTHLPKTHNRYEKGFKIVQPPVAIQLQHCIISDRSSWQITKHNTPGTIWRVGAVFLQMYTV